MKKKTEAKRKKDARSEEEEEGDDRISKLPDDVIHIIMSFLDTRFAVQTSKLSKRWRFVWKTLPFLNFNGYKSYYYDNKTGYAKFLEHVFKSRNNQSSVKTVELYPYICPDLRLMKKYVKYSISHRVEILNFKTLKHCPLSLFSSNALTKLKLAMKFESAKVMQPECWSLPNLTVLSLTCYDYGYRKLPEWCLTCLPKLKTLCLGSFALPEFFGLPGLTRLCLENCVMPQKIWDLPNVVTLELESVRFVENMREYFVALANLRTLIVDHVLEHIKHCIISSSQLVNLTIRAPLNNLNATEGNIMVLAPKLRNLRAIGFFRMGIESSELENVDIKYWDSLIYKNKAPSWVLNKYQDLFKVMFSQLGSTKILALDLVSLEALSEISDILVHLRSPFYNLKYLKLPYGYEESSMSNSVRQYLLGDSPSVTVINALVQEDVAPSVSLVSQNVLLEEPLETPVEELKSGEDTSTPTKELIDPQCTHENRLGDAIGMGVPKEHRVGNPVVDSNTVIQTEAPVAQESNDWASSSRNNSCFVLWRGHEVNSEFAGLLNLIMKKYPETFEKLASKNKKIWTMKLNMLCSLVNDFTKTSTTEVDTEMLTEYRAIFNDLQRWGFNVNWLMSRLNYIEQLRFSNPRAVNSYIDEDQSRLQDVQSPNSEKMTDSEKCWTLGSCSTVASASYIGDDLL